MSDAPIVLDGVWKKFRRGEHHDSLRDLIPATARALFRRRRGDGLERHEFWAVEDVSFEVNRGEALGIIGPNGAGKSTTLKLLTRILKPTRGRCEIKGRTGALIEIAAGFHPDLTGRENIYLQGAIMGMRRAEISRKFDQIVDFSGVSEFIDTQVKRYSSGMNARLGFAIAAHLNAEVLLIDEVLSVGDFSFQQRAFDRLKEIVTSGTPTVVVSHQLERIASLCSHAILLRRGRVVDYGSPAHCIRAYATSQVPVDSSAGDFAIGLDGITNSSGDPIPSGERARFAVTGRVRDAEGASSLAITLRVRSIQTGQLVFVTSTLRHGIQVRDAGPFALHFDLQMNVPAGDYSTESLVVDMTSSTELFVGPIGHLRVSDGTSFWGPVQMNARLHLEAPEPTGSGVLDSRS